MLLLLLRLSLFDELLFVYFLHGLLTHQREVDLIAEKVADVAKRLVEHLANGVQALSVLQALHVQVVHTLLAQFHFTYIAQHKHTKLNEFC